MLPSSGLDRRDWWILLAIIGVALTLRAWAAIYYPNILWPDEIFQTLEPAHRLAYGIGIVTWEWQDGVRNWVLPGTLAAVMRATGWVATGSSVYLLAVHLLLCTLSLTVVLVAFLWARRVGGLPAGLMAAGMCAVSAELIYFAPKALYEVVAAHLLFPGLYLAQSSEWTEHPRRRLILAGVLLAAAAMLRVQLAPAVLVAAIWVCRLQFRERWLPLAGGAAPVAIFFGVVDALTWGGLFKSYWHYVAFQAQVGSNIPGWSAPWYDYARIVTVIQPLWLLLVVVALGLFLFALGARRAPLLAWVGVVIILVHSVVGHKEPRYIYPSVPPVWVVLALGAWTGLEYMQRRFPARRLVTAGVVGWLLLYSVVTLQVARNTRHKWVNRTGSLKAFEQLSRSSELCGLGLLGTSWLDTGGYSYLHLAVPLYEVGEEASATASPQFNFLMAVDKQPKLEGYRLDWCVRSACVFRREGGCKPPPNDVPRRRLPWAQ